MTYRPQVKNWTGFTVHAAPEAIAAHLAEATTAQIQATRDVARLTALLAERQRQVAAGEWPPQPKTQVLSVRFTDEELAELDAYALARGMSRSDVLRTVIERWTVPRDETGGQP